VLVLDDAEPRNFAARGMHGVLGHDGMDPAALRARGVEELGRYGIGVRVEEVEADRVRAVEGGVEVGGERARALIIATGLLDRTPDIVGFDAIYGVTAHTCPYCDGWEHRDRRLAVYAPIASGAHLARLLRQWSGDVVVFTGGGASVDAEEELELAELGVIVVRAPVESFVEQDGQLKAVELSGRLPIARDALFFYVGVEPRTAVAEALGCALNETGFIVAAPEDRQTSVDRVYAAGNCVDPTQNVPLATADGFRAGASVNLRLVHEGHVQAAVPPHDP
jgi:thioredoxin reductase